MYTIMKGALFMKKYKVIVWGLGSVGRYAVKMIQSKKSLELVGAVDVDPKKVGKDAGESLDSTRPMLSSPMILTKC